MTEPGRVKAVPAVRGSDVVAAIEDGGSILDRLARRRERGETRRVVCRYCGGRGHVNWKRCDECDNGTLLLTPAADHPEGGTS